MITRLPSESSERFAGVRSKLSVRNLRDLERIVKIKGN